MDIGSTNTCPTPQEGLPHRGRPFVVWLIILYAGIAGAVGLIYTPLILLGIVSVPAPQGALLLQAGIMQWVISISGGLLCLLLALSLLRMQPVAVKISVILFVVSAASFAHHFFKLDYQSLDRMHVFLGSAAFNLSVLFIIVLYVRRLAQRRVLTSGRV